MCFYFKRMGQILRLSIILTASVVIQSDRIDGESIKKHRFPRFTTPVKRILHFSDIHLNISENLDDSLQFETIYGRDSSLTLLLSAINYAKSVLPDPDIFLYTGDHAVHALSTPFNESYLRNVVRKNVEVLNSYFENPSYTAIIGNSDSVPDYEMVISDPESELNPTILAISDAWKNVFTEDQMNQFNRRGYMSFSVDERLIVITLNTIPYSPSHTPKSSEVQDPFGQFEWLENQLEEIRSQNKFAYICGHIPPIVDSYGGKTQWEVQYIQKYKTIVETYNDVIKAHFYGHVHSVEMRLPIQSHGLFKNDAPLFTVGSISPLFGNNPSFLVWEYDSFTYEVLDYSVYGTNISTVEPFFNWRLLFRASEVYKVTSLSTRKLQFLLGQFESDPSFLEQYFWNTKAQSHRQQPCTDTLCRASVLCSMQWWTTADEYQSCINATESRISPFSVSVSDSSDNKAYKPYTFGPFSTFILMVVLFGAVLLVLGGIYVGTKSSLYRSTTRLRYARTSDTETYPISTRSSRRA